MLAQAISSTSAGDAEQQRSSGVLRFVVHAALAARARLDARSPWP